MDSRRLGRAQLSESDLDFVVAVTSPEAKEPERIKAAIRADEAFREAVLGDERVFRSLSADHEAVVHVSPLLYFEVLLRKARRELQIATYTVERTGSQRIPVFDSREVTELLKRPEVLEYLAELLASFTLVRSYARPIRVRQGIWGRERFKTTETWIISSRCARWSARRSA